MNTSAGQYTYQGMFLDTYSSGSWTTGSQLVESAVTLNPCIGGSNANCSNTEGDGSLQPWPDRIWVEEQLDNSSQHSQSTYCDGTGQTVCAFYDNYSLTVWN